MGYDFLHLVPNRTCYLLPLEHFTIFFTRLRREPGKRCGKAGHFDIIKGVGHSEDKGTRQEMNLHKIASFIFVLFTSLCILSYWKQAPYSDVLYFCETGHASQLSDMTAVVSPCPLPSASLRPGCSAILSRRDAWPGSSEQETKRQPEHNDTLVAVSLQVDVRTWAVARPFHQDRLCFPRCRLSVLAVLRLVTSEFKVAASVSEITLSALLLENKRGKHARCLSSKRITPRSLASRFLLLALQAKLSNVATPSCKYGRESGTCDPDTSDVEQ